MSDAAGYPEQASDLADAEVYHLELRQFPHNVCRFNLTERELWATVAERWAQEQWVEVEERKWSPHQAKLTVLQGPRLPLEQLSMGRGWRAAQRDGRDVTARVIAAAKERAGEHRQARPNADGAPSAGSGETAPPPGGAQRAGSGETPSPQGGAPRAQDEGLLADSLGLELLALLGTERAPLRRVWELAGERHPERTAGERLALAERAVASLLRSRLVELVWGDDAANDVWRPVGDEQIQAVLRSIDSWSGATAGVGDGTQSVWICRV